MNHHNTKSQNLRIKIFLFFLIVTSLLGYLEWGQGQSSFLFEVELNLFNKLFNDPLSVLHPFTVIPFLGQILLLIALFQKVPNKILVYFGIACLGLLWGFIFFIGIIGMNLKVIGSALPFILTAIFTIHYFRKP